MKATSIVVLLTVCALNGFAQHPSFSFRRKIENVKEEKWYNVVLSNEMMPHLQSSFNDIRIYNINEGDTTEIPFLLKIMEDQVKEETFDFPVLNESHKENDLFFTVDTKGASINYLDLDFAQDNYNAFLKIEGSHNQSEWFTVTQKHRILAINNEGVLFKAQKIIFPTVNYRYLRVSIQSDALLKLVRASFKYQSFKPGVINNYPSSFVVSNTKSKQSIVDISLPALSLINTISIAASSDGDFYRPFTLECLSDSSKSAKGWITFYTKVTDGYLTSISPNHFAFELHPAKKLRLTVENHDNVPLKIQSATLSGPKVFLIAKLKPENNFVFYGNKSTAAPVYDLVHFQKNIPDSIASLSLEREEILSQSASPSQPLFNSKIWLWVVMTMVIVLLGFFTLKMMRNK